MNNRFYLTVSIITLLIGSLFFAYQKEWIVFRLPKFKMQKKEPDSKIIKKNIKLYFWKNNKWNWETIEIIYTNNIADNIHKITSGWLNLLDEEKVTDKKITLQSAMNGINEQEIYLSFDRSLFNEESSTFNKLILIESLLKTIRDNDINLNKIYFLVHHQEMKDNHLDFSHPWPIIGFLKDF